MGIYIYSLRAKTVQLDVSGTKSPVHLYSYAYRYSSMWRGDYGYAGYKLTEANTERHAHNVMGDRTTIPYVIVGDFKDKGIEGATVYANVTSPVWFDTDKFPGTVAGWVRKVGKGYVLADRTEWQGNTKAHRDGIWVPVRTRSIMVDGKATEEMEDLTPPPEQSELTNPMDHII